MRRALFMLGLVALVLLWTGPLPKLAERAFFAHMTMHIGVVAVAAPLIALGVAGGPLDPVRYAPRFFLAIPASMLELVVVWAWHAPGLHEVARHTAAGLVIEQTLFLLSGLLLWLAACGGRRPRGGGRSAAGVVGLLLTSIHMTLLGALLALAPRPLYHAALPADLPRTGLTASDICGLPVDWYSSGLGLTPLSDQHLGGALMILIGGASYLLGGLGLTVSLLREPRWRSGATV